MPLPLYGIAKQVTHSADGAASRQVLRLRAATETPECEEDAAIVRNAADMTSSLSKGFEHTVIVADQPFNAASEACTGYQIASHFGFLGSGDIIGLDRRSGRFRIHYRKSSHHNSFLVTERCNHYCLMCSQPPKNVDDRWILREIEACIPLISKSTKFIGFTGGEPLLEYNAFLKVLGMCRDQLPSTAVHVLSNGRAFAASDVVAGWAALQHPDLSVGIPLYAAVDELHDYVVQARGAFDETVLGILKLKDRGCRVEVRVVLHAITAPRLLETCRWLARNLPFVDHVALMGLENTGFAIANDGMLWIDPADYQDQLADGIRELASSGTRVSVYNLPLCVLRPSVRAYAVKSISDWKNGYQAECVACEERPNCSGFFTTGRPKFSRAIRRLTRPDDGDAAIAVTTRAGKLIASANLFES